MMPDMWAGIIRHLLTFGGGLAVSKGWLDADTATQIVGGAATVIGGIWSVWSKAK